MPENALTHVLDEIVISPDVAKLTDGNINGNGVFDVLMRSVGAHIEKQYEEHRIDGKDFAQVYLGGLSAVLRTSAQYILNESQAAKHSSEIGLLRQKTVTELAQTADTLLAGLGFNEDTVVGGTVAKQKALVAKQTDGFDRDAEQKILKAILDFLSVLRTTDEGFPIPDSLVATEMDKVIAKGKAGINVV